MDWQDSHAGAPAASDVEYFRAFGARFAEARRHANLTQEQVGQALNVRKSAISRLERGRSDPTQTRVMQLAKLYGVSQAWLCGEVEHPTGLRPGWTVADRRALEVLEKAVAAKGTLDDIKSIATLPGLDVAWQVPQDPILLDQREARALRLKVEQAVAKLRRNTP